MDYNLLLSLLIFDVQTVSDLAMEPFQAGFWIFLMWFHYSLSISYFLVQDIPFHSFPAPGLESAKSPWSPEPFYWKMEIRNQTQGLDFITHVSIGLSPLKKRVMCLFIFEWWLPGPVAIIHCSIGLGKKNKPVSYLEFLPVFGLIYGMDDHKEWVMENNVNSEEIIKVGLPHYHQNNYYISMVSKVPLNLPPLTSQFHHLQMFPS